MLEHRAAVVLALFVMNGIGELVGRGRTSDVYAYGPGSVVKVAHDDVPLEWPAFEAEITRAVWELGVAAPKVHDVVVIKGRPSVVYERIAGPSLWQQMIDRPSDTPRLARELAAIQKELLQIGIPPGVPDLVDRLVRKIELASGLTPREQVAAKMLVESLPRGAALLHGDLHPGNVLMGKNGPVVIDWFDASIGHPVADVVRSSILMQSNVGAAPRHLPRATRHVLHELRHTYLAEFRSELEMAAVDLAGWQGVVAAGRLAEDAELDDTALMALWRARTDEQSGHSLLV